MRLTTGYWVLIAGFAGVTLVLSWQMPRVNFTLNETGLVSLTFKGKELLANGNLSVDAIEFEPAIHELNSPRPQFSADKEKKTVRLTYSWGEVVTAYSVSKNALNLAIDVTNRSGSSIRSIRMTPMVLHFPQKPAEYDGQIPILATNIGAPAALTLTIGTSRLVVTDEDPVTPLLIGFPWAADRPASLTYPLRIVTGREPTYPDSYPVIDRPIAPGQTDRYRLALHFGSSSQSVSQLASDVLDRYTQNHPATLDWPDRRPIASLIIGTAAAGWHSNPRGWLMDKSIDVTTPAGVADFQRKLLEWADRSIVNLLQMNAQGMITWDIEGEEFPHPVTYVGDPMQAGKLAPEISGVIDRYFERFRDAGLRVGVTVRPQEFYRGEGAEAPVQRAVNDPSTLLISKIKYARDRWKATLFYVDSNGVPGFPMNAEIFEKVRAAVPNVLLIPEHKNLLYYASTAPYSELRQGFAGTPPLFRAAYPRAFSVINVTDGPVDQRRAELQQAVRAGDILLFRGWYLDQYSAAVKALMQ